MSCNLTSGFTLDCRDSVGGIKSIYVSTTDSVDSYTEMDGEISEITMDEVEGVFYKYELRKQTSDFTETIEASDENGTLFYEQELNVMLSRMEANKRNELFLVAKAPVVAIVEDRNGKFWILGQENGLTLGGSATSGTAMGDRNGYELVFTGQESAPAKEVEGSVMDTIT